MSATDELRPWWERYPERLGWELANFADLGLSASSDRGRGGPWISTTVELSDRRQMVVTVTFPYEYPIEPPLVRVEPDLLGPPHEAGGLLCLFDNPANQWNRQRSAADLIAGRVTRLLEGLLVAGELPADLEEQIPELNFLRYTTDPGRVVLVPDPFWGELPEIAHSGSIVLMGDEDRRLLCFVEGFGPSADLAGRVGCEVGIELGRWIELPEPPPGYHTANEIFALARERCPELLDPVGVGTLGPSPPEWVAINFPGPGARAGEKRRRWGLIKLTGPQTVPPSAEAGWDVQALSFSERQLRTPELIGLERAKIALLGVGSLGSKVAIELAKAGCGKLVLVDPDTYDVNNAVRHELAPLHAGEGKATAMTRAVELTNPFCKAEPMAQTIGVGGPPVDFLRAIEGAALVIETTGARSTTRICERYCRIAGVPLLSASLTRGSRGGDMVLLDVEGCFDCFLLAQNAGEIPKPDAAEQDVVVPIGCADPAFSGAGFDASELSSVVARTAIRATGLTEYPALDHNWAVLNFAASPHWQQGTIKPDPRCRHER